MTKNLNDFKARIKARLRHGSFGRNVAIMFMGTALGQLSTVLLSPVLTRIYSPDLFGILGFFTALVSILAIISSLRYDMALTLPKTNEEAANLLSVCFTILGFMTAIFFGIVFFASHDWVAYLFGSLEPYRFMLPVGFFCIGAYQIMVGYATRQGSFAIISKTKIYQGVSSPLTQIGLGLMGSGAWGLIIGFIIGQSAGVTNLIMRLIIKPGDVLVHVKRKEMLVMAKRFSSFPLVSSWSAIINVLGTNSMMMIVVPMLYSNTIAGFIFLTERVIGRPLILISTSILQVYLGEAAKTQTSDPKAMRRRFIQIIKGQTIIVSSWLLVINATAFYLVPIIFGKDWADAVIYMHILSISYLPQMVMIAVVHTLQIMEKQILTAIWELSRLILIVAGFSISYFLILSPVQALLIYSISQAVMQLVLFILMYTCIHSLQPKE